MEKKPQTSHTIIQLLWDLLGYSLFLALYEGLSLKSRLPVSPSHAGLHGEAGCPPPTFPHALHSLTSPQGSGDNLTSTRVCLIWLPVVYKKKEKQLVYFSMINFARNYFQSSKFGLWSCYVFHTGLFPVLSRGATSAISLGCSGSLKVGSICVGTYSFTCGLYPLLNGAYWLCFRAYTLI